MPRKKPRCYAVKAGRKPGVYRTWAECQEQITGYGGAVYKGFQSLTDARGFLGDSSAEPKASVGAEAEPDVGASPASDRVVVHTDGACSGNPGPGGFGVVMKHQGTRRELSGGFAKTTNNRMELMACIAALAALKRRCEVTLHTDSKYVVDAMTRGWVQGWRRRGWQRKDGPVANADLWKRLFDLCQKHGVEFKWVAGHAGNTENERCDELAVEAAAGKNLPTDDGYEATPPPRPSRLTQRKPEDSRQTKIVFE